MADYLAPGVYVEEFDSGGQPLGGVSTSTAGFIGLAQRGPNLGLPQFVSSPNDFRRIFGSYLAENQFGQHRYLAYAVEHFFLNGGSRAFVMRVTPTDAKPAMNFTDATKDTVPLQVVAKNPGAWANQVRIFVVPSSKAKTSIEAVIGGADSKKYLVKNSAGFTAGDVVAFNPNDYTKRQYREVVSAQDNVIELSEALDGGNDVVDKAPLPKLTLTTREFTVHVLYGSEEEVYEKCSLNAAADNYVEKKTAKSNIVSITSQVKSDGKDVVPPFKAISTLDEGPDDVKNEKERVKFQIELAGGGDGSIAGVSVDTFIGIDNGPGNRSGIKAFIDNDDVSIISVPGNTDAAVQLDLVAHCEMLGSRIAILDIPQDSTTIEAVMDHRNMFDSNYAAMYNPWLKVYDPLDKRNIFIPPSGSMAGIYARSDTTRGVHKAPANEVIRGCLGLNVQYNKAEQDILNPKGVNLIRSFTGQGIRVWGARTCSSNSLWKYINVRRLFIFLEESIKSGTNWVVFEPNDEQLWARVQRTLDAFLTRVWRDGALMGASPAEAFYINIGRSTMTQDDLDNGKLICVIGVAPVKPAEFVIFRITQKTSESQ